MRRILALWLLWMTTISASLHGRNHTTDIIFDSSAADKYPVCTVVNEDGRSLTLEIRIPRIHSEVLSIDGEEYHLLNIPGGELRGSDGMPGLPSFSDFVAIPEEASVSVSVEDIESKVFSGYRPLPIPPDDGSNFVMDHETYTRTSKRDEPVVELGNPAIMHGIRLVPLTVNPVSYEPDTGELNVISRIIVTVDFTGRDLPNSTSRLPRTIPESFHRIFDDTVVNYESVFERNDVEVSPGTYLLIYPSATGVLPELQPLIDWRKEQGYTVLTASTSQTGTSTTSIKNYISNIYNTVDPPLEFVSLAGDASGSYTIPTYSYSGGGGDHQYTTLEGSDNLADIHIGRISFSSLGSLSDIIDKIITYETNPPTTDSGWFTRACLAGDPGTSGETCIWVNQWLKNQLIREGYTQIDTLWSGPWVSGMSNGINQGVTVFGYRGWLGMSGMDTGDISALTNGYELPFALMPTCGTGDFDYGTSRSEAFLRNSNGGAIGAIGTATINTHTRYNNSYYSGTWHGALSGDHKLGSAHTRGKLNLFLNFGYDGDAAMRFSVWNNLMGDPATEMWTGYPDPLSVSYPATLPEEANSIPITVTSATLPVSDALVTVYQPGVGHVSMYTDFNGYTNIPISGIGAGEAKVTVTRHNHMPHRGTVSIGTVTDYIVYEDSSIDDDMSGGSSGNDNGVVNPGETIELPVSLRNVGTSPAPSVTGTIGSTDPLITITDSEETFGTIGSGSTAWSDEDFDVVINPTTPDGHEFHVDLTAASGASEWTSVITLNVQSAAFNILSYTWGGGGATPDPGESGTLSIKLHNVGSIAGSGVSAHLESASPWIEVTDDSGTYGTMVVGAQSENTGDPFSMNVAADCPNGHKAECTLTLTFNGQMQDIIDFTYGIGSAVTTTDPTGPDTYGYYAFDNTDTGYLFAPTYDWVEIDPNHGGSGTNAGLGDFGWEQDDTEVFDLPFTFRFYGQEYDQISICSNGWVAMGQNYLTVYANQYLPGSYAPAPVICPMWDNLYQSGTNRVYVWFDSTNHRYGIQWSRVKNDYYNSTQNFQMFLYDPGYHPTATGDGEILFQYATVNNNDSRDGYVTVGIQNEDHTDGLLYTYANDYTPGSTTLASGRAIRILPIGSLNLGTLEGDVTNDSDGGTPLSGVDIRILEIGQILTSGEGGTYSGPVQEGTYTVRAEHPSFDLVTEPGVEIIEDQTTELDFALTDNLGPDISNTTRYSFTDDETGPYEIETVLFDYSTIDSKSLFYTLNEGTPVEVPLTLVSAATGLHRAEIPGQPLGTRIDYWIEAEDVAANQSRDPQGSDTYSFWILTPTPVVSHDMEQNHGYTIGASGDDASAGIWERVDPNGIWEGSTEVQPEDDATPDPGVMCYITGNDPPGSSQGVDDVDGGKTTLLTPWFDLSGYLDASVSYRRWYTNDTGNSPGQDYWVVSATDDGTSWVNLENTNTSDRSWALKSFTLSDYIDLSETVRFRFIASDEGSGSIVEAGVDDFEIQGYMVTASLSGTINGGQLELTWSTVAGASDYWIHGVNNAPFFVPAMGNRLAVIPAGTTTWTTTSGIGDPDQNWFYLVRGVDASEQEIIRTNRVGAFDYATEE